MIGQKQLIIAVASLALLGGSFAYGIHKGTVWQIQKQEDDRLALQEQLFDLADDLSVKNSEILRLQEERKGLINDLEQAATEAVGSDNPGVATTGGLQRLEQRWGPSPNSP